MCLAITLRGLHAHVLVHVLHHGIAVFHHLGHLLHVHHRHMVAVHHVHVLTLFCLGTALGGVFGLFGKTRGNSSKGYEGSKGGVGNGVTHDGSPHLRPWFLAGPGKRLLICQKVRTGDSCRGAYFGYY
ncbi:hypothetical protein DENIT_20189 [Pseudomonas veronii]|nr:hypothetical protein DENIT_20189 [Pseudomonas veronii]